MSKNNKNNKNNDIGFMAMSKVTAYAYYFIISNLLFFVSILLPGAWLLFFEPNLLNIVALGFIFPGLAALVSCGIKFKESEEKVKFSVLKEFIDGYKKNFKDTIKYCFIYAAIVFAAVSNINYYGVEMPMFLIVALGISGTLSTLMVTYAMAVATKFQFKLKDLMGVSISCIIIQFKTTIKIVIMYLVLLFVLPGLGLFIVLLLTSPIIYLLITFIQPALEYVHEYFIASPPPAEPE